MSSATSTSRGRPEPDALPASTPDASELQPWQFFVLAALACATALTLMARGQNLTSVILLTVLMGTAVLVGLAGLRMVRPLLTDEDDSTPMIGERTRVALEREKMLALRAIKELEFDQAMGKISDDDFREMTLRLRTRAGRLMRQLDAGVGYREQVEREVSRRLGAGPAAKGGRSGAIAEAPGRVCGSCSTENDGDATFCKRCGAKLA